MAKKILIVDDEADIVKTVSIMLEMEGFEVITSQDGLDGLKKAYAHSPDLIILDMVLPGLSGNEILELLRKDAHYKKTPVILITAQIQKPNPSDLKEYAPDYFLSKPFSLENLKDKIYELLKVSPDTEGENAAE